MLSVDREPFYIRREFAFLTSHLIMPGASQVALVVKNLLTNAGDVRDVGSIPGQEGPLEEWQPTPAFLPGKSHGQRSLAGYSSWGRRVRRD